VLLLDLTAVGVPAEQVRVLDGWLAAALDERGVDALSRADLRTMASMAADRFAVGCDDASRSCLAELAAALGAELVVSGQVGKLDAFYIVQLSLFDASAGRPIAREEVRGLTLTLAAADLERAVGRLFADVPEAVAAQDAERPSALVWFGGGTIVVGAAVGATLGGITWALDHGLANKDPEPRARAFALRAEPFTLAGTVVGLGVAAVGGVVLAIGLSE
jgi:hypothetical protein